jgi:hypothetical protein
VAGVPCCVWNWGWFFNSVREPRVGCDKMMRYEGDYLVALRRGRVFKVMLRENGEVVSFDKLKATFDAIAGHVTDSGLWTGMLTTDERDSWAEVCAFPSSNPFLTTRMDRTLTVPERRGRS